MDYLEYITGGQVDLGRRQNDLITSANTQNLRVILAINGQVTHLVVGNILIRQAIALNGQVIITKGAG